MNVTHVINKKDSKPALIAVLQPQEQIAIELFKRIKNDKLAYYLALAITAMTDELESQQRITRTALKISKAKATGRKTRK